MRPSGVGAEVVELPVAVDERRRGGGERVRPAGSGRGSRGTTIAARARCHLRRAAASPRDQPRHQDGPSRAPPRAPRSGATARGSGVRGETTSISRSVSQNVGVQRGHVVEEPQVLLEGYRLVGAGTSQSPTSLHQEHGDAIRRRATATIGWSKQSGSRRGSRAATAPGLAPPGTPAARSVQSASGSRYFTTYGFAVEGRPGRAAPRTCRPLERGDLGGASQQLADRTAVVSLIQPVSPRSARCPEPLVHRAVHRRSPPVHPSAPPCTRSQQISARPGGIPSAACARFGSVLGSTARRHNVVVSTLCSGGIGPTFRGAAHERRSILRFQEEQPTEW